MMILQLATQRDGRSLTSSLSGLLGRRARSSLSKEAWKIADPSATPNTCPGIYEDMPLHEELKPYLSLGIAGRNLSQLLRRML